MTTQWVRLKRGNDFETEYLALEPLNKNSIASATRGLMAKDGEGVRIRLGDGTVLEGGVKIFTTMKTYGRTEHPYIATTKMPKAMVEVHGTVVAVELDQVDVPLEWVKERLPKFCVGDRVRALNLIEQAHFRGYDRWTHAMEGELGVVEVINVNMLPVVRFDHTGSSVTVGPSEVEVIEWT